MKTVWSYITETLSEWSQDGASRLAAALSYYTIFSLAPLLVIAVAIAGLVFNQSTVQAQLSSQIQGMIGPQGAQAVMSMLSNATQIGSGVFASILSILILLFGASGVFGQLQASMNIIWDVPEKPKRGILWTVRQRFLSFTLVVGVGFLLLVSLIASALLSGLNSYLSGQLPGLGSYLWEVLGFLISFAVITLVFAVIFKVLPDRYIPWRHVWLGALMTSLLFNIGKYLIGLYLGRASVTSAYGAAGSLVIILLWVYYSAQILFLGAEFTQVYLRRHTGSPARVPLPAAPRPVAPQPAAPQPAASGTPRPADARRQPRELAVPVTGAALPAPASVLPVLGLMATAVAAWAFVIFRLIIPGAGPFRRLQPQTRRSERLKSAGRARLSGLLRRLSGPRKRVR